MGLFSRRGPEHGLPEEKLQDKRIDKDQKGISRRDFLLGALVGATALAFGGVAEAGKPKGKKRDEIITTRNPEMEKFEQASAAIEVAVKAIAPPSPDGTNRWAATYCSAEKMIEMRKEFLEKYLNLFTNFSDNAFSLFEKFSKSLSAQEVYSTYILPIALKTYSILRNVDCHGMVVSVVDKVNPGNSTAQWPGHFGVKTFDYLPDAKFVRSFEIDPLQGSSSNSGKEYKERSFWGTEIAQASFRKLLADPIIRERFSREANLTLAGAYSLIKAVVERKNLGNSTVSDFESLEELLAERETFKAAVLIGHETTVVHYYGRDTAPKGIKQDHNIFDPQIMSRIEKICGVKKSIVHKAEDGPGEKTDFLKNIVDTSGPIFVYVGTHGGEKVWATDSDNPESAYIEVTEVAAALLERLYTRVFKDGPRKAEQMALSEITIFADNCNSYQFLFANLLPAMQNLHKNFKIKGMPDDYRSIDLSMVQMPRVISAAQKGSIAFLFFGQTVSAYADAIKQAGAFRGKDLFTLEADLYELEDISISSSRAGAIEQIGALENWHAKTTAPT